MTNKDKTGNERQARRRERERKWLDEHGYKSWESLHTALMLCDVALQVVSVPTQRRADSPKRGRAARSRDRKSKVSKPA